MKGKKGKKKEEKEGKKKERKERRERKRMMRVQSNNCEGRLIANREVTTGRARVLTPFAIRLSDDVPAPYFSWGEYNFYQKPKKKVNLSSTKQ